MMYASAVWFLFVLLPSFLAGPPQLLPARVLGFAALAADLRGGPPLAGDDVVLVELTDRKGADAQGRLLGCRAGGTWRSGAECELQGLVGKELRVFSGAAPDLGRFVPASTALVAGQGMVLRGTVTPALPPATDDDALRVPFAVFSPNAPSVVVPTPGTLPAERLDELLVAGKRAARMHQRMSEGMVVEHQLVADLSPTLPGVALVAASNAAEGDTSPTLPSASLLFLHADARDGARDITRFVAVQVISGATDARAFERFRVAAVVDLDGNGWREMIVRARSLRGDRYRAFEVDDSGALRPLGGWAGDHQPSAPTR